MQINLKWHLTSRLLLLIMLMVLIIAGFGIHFFVAGLNSIQFLGFQLGYFIASQGILWGFVILVCWYASRQNELDDEHDITQGYGSQRQ
ncbi:MAG: DUF4212 domain-containing protein [Cohaesibacteraceae bacterium]|nr:DUF4212 domain-containing protein [Cohaesibacteraceae bacterium]MBL4877060.1 DUF4212 domain-containing protein [Cohaesibacteraceae bacterium]